MKKLSSHQQRLITGILLFAILLLVLYIGNMAVALALFIISMIALSEIYNILGVHRNPIIMGISGAITCLIFALAYTNNAYLMLISSIYIIMLPMLLFLVLWGIFNVSLRMEQYVFMIFGLLYIPFLLQFSLLFSIEEQIFVLLITSTSDIGAYIGGRMFGKTPIWKRISPNKTIEGATTGLFLCTFLCLIYGSVFLQYSVWGLLIIILILNAGSQLGDFFESGIKRVYNVKDSGKILPGHGGILDRIDSLLFVIPTYYVIKLILL